MSAATGEPVDLDAIRAALAKVGPSCNHLGCDNPDCAWHRGPEWLAALLAEVARLNEQVARWKPRAIAAEQELTRQRHELDRVKQVHAETLAAVTEERVRETSALRAALAEAQRDAARWAIVREGWLAANLPNGTVEFELPGLSGGSVRVSGDANATVDEAVRYKAVRDEVLARPRGGEREAE